MTGDCSACQEIDHRIRNSLQMVASTLRLRARQQAGTPAESALLDGASSVHAIALVHSLLLTAHAVQAIDFEAYLSALCDGISHAHGFGDRITCTVAVIPRPGGYWIAADTAGRAGQAVSEIITNAARHAFPKHRQGRIVVAISPMGDQIRCAITDDGAGYQPDQAIPAPPHKPGLGLRIVEGLITSWGGAVHRVSSAAGTSVSFTIPSVRQT